jgi:hypothetical protein
MYELLRERRIAIDTRNSFIEGNNGIDDVQSIEFYDEAIIPEIDNRIAAYLESMKDVFADIELSYVFEDKDDVKFVYFKSNNKIIALKINDNDIIFYRKPSRNEEFVIMKILYDRGLF